VKGKKIINQLFYIFRKNSSEKFAGTFANGRFDATYSLKASLLPV
jgi:hypothetical protein